MSLIKNNYTDRNLQEDMQACYNSDLCYLLDRERLK